MRPRARFRLALAVAALAAGGGGGGSAVAAEPVAGPGAEAAKRTTEVRLQRSDFGRVLFDRSGGALYLFTADTGADSTCYGQCAIEWPPFYARGKLRAGPGVDRKLLGKTTRTDGRRQVTYAGHPLYYWYRDPPNEILCHNVFEFGGDWLVVTKSGRPAG